MGALRPIHIILLLVVIVLLFGARRLPDLARSVGQSLKVFKDEVKELTDDGKGGATTSAAEPAAAGSTGAPTGAATATARVADGPASAPGPAAAPHLGHGPADPLPHPDDANTLRG
ncbi:Sec-independent protein translocase subunit TatA [Luteimicrobium sp. NPDC057192]|uniref:Sec-independent protein translocase subunit TatA n=1 Tax=Luteimicrobium sp. NPDC057192 TaxID=3346042 RepID=UPI00362C6182